MPRAGSRQYGEAGTARTPPPTGPTRNTMRAPSASSARGPPRTAGNRRRERLRLFRCGTGGTKPKRVDSDPCDARSWPPTLGASVLEHRARTRRRQRSYSCGSALGPQGDDAGRTCGTGSGAEMWASWIGWRTARNLRVVATAARPASPLGTRRAAEIDRRARSSNGRASAFVTRRTS